MSFELSHLFGLTLAYLGLLFLIASAADLGWIPARIVHHPVTYTLSLGVYATSWTYYGSVGFAQSQGYNFLTIYLGVTLAFLLTPVLLSPILRLTREYQLTSLADLFAFRFRSQLAGMLVTLFMLAGTLPYIALQIRAVTESLRILSDEAAPDVVAFGFCLMLTVFAILFGARHISPREKHTGLVAAIAFESLVKLAALLGVMAFALFGVFDGPQDMNAWLARHPQALDALYQPVREGPWFTLLLLSFAAAFLLPRQFHMTFAENMNPRSLEVASWAFPLFLLLLALAIPPILWAGIASGAETPPDYYVLGITLDSSNSLLPLMAFIGGVSAASAMMIVTSLALSSMVLNHLLLPASFPHSRVDVYRWVLWGRRLIIGLIILAGYGVYLQLQHNESLVQIGLLSFVAVAQFLPGIIGVLYWRRATRSGFIIGLAGGASVWAWILILPLFDVAVSIPFGLDSSPLNDNRWSFVTFWSLVVNGLLFVLVSLLTRPGEDELEAASACCQTSLRPPSGVVSAANPQQFVALLAPVVGEHTARIEVNNALEDLAMDARESRPTQLRYLRDRIERNLSGLIGPQLARVVVDTRLTLDASRDNAFSESMQFMEEKLEASQTRLQGLAAELDSLRRYQKEILLQLPLGVCAVGPDHRITLWNYAMTALSGISRHDAISSDINALPTPWSGFLNDFLVSSEQHKYKLQTEIAGQPRWFNLHKANIAGLGGDSDDQRRGSADGSVILIEDLTGIHTLEAELIHSERLASIGRLSAGVAHEIGNPLTGISSLAQNLEYDHSAENVRETAQIIIDQAKRIGNIVQTLVSFSHGGRPPDQAMEEVQLHHCANEAIQLVSFSREAKQIAFHNHIDAELKLVGDKQRLCQILVNLLSNAADASQPGDPVEIHATEASGRVILRIADQGTSIPESVRDQVFDPFYTTKDPGEGTGLGLPLVYSMVKDHGGSIALKDNPESSSGTLAELHFPVEHSP